MKKSLAELETLQRRDKRRLLLMSLGALVLLAGVIAGQFLSKRYESQEQNRLARTTEPPPVAEVYMPPFTDSDWAVLDQIRDGDDVSRMTISDEPRRMLLSYATLLTERHYQEKLKIAEADGALLGSFVSDPTSKRMKALRLHGVLTELATYFPEGAPYPEYRGRIEVEGGGAAAFAVTRDPALDGILGDSFVRLDGLFLQVLRREGEAGWEDLPLLCSRELIPSWPTWNHDEDELSSALAEVEDDSLEKTTRISSTAQWRLLLKAGAKVEDWAAAPELDGGTLTQIFKQPSLYRGRAYRLPVSVNMGLGDPLRGENPLREAAFSTGWIGNMAWTGPAPVIKWLAVGDGAELLDWRAEAHLVEARGYFLRNENYEANDGRPLRAPVFVLDEIKVFHPEVSDRTSLLLFVLLGTLGALGTLIFVLLKRDNQRAAHLQAELTRRRQERRSRRSDGLTEG